MLGDADRVAVGDLGDRDPALARRLQVGMVRTDARRDHQLDVPRLREALGGHVSRPEGLRDDHVRVDQLALENRFRPVLVGGDDQLVPGAFDEFPQAQLARHAAEQAARLEVDRPRRRQGLTAGIALDLGQIVARIACRITVDWIVVEDAEDLHGGAFPGSGNPRTRRRPAGRLFLYYQKRWMATAGVTDDCVLCPFGTTHTPTMTPARSLQLYSTAGAKPMFQLLSDVWLTSAPLPSRPVTLVLPHWSRSMSNASTHSFVRLYSAPRMTVVLDPGL